MQSILAKQGCEADMDLLDFQSDTHTHTVHSKTQLSLVQLISQPPPIKWSHRKQ